MGTLNKTQTKTPKTEVVAPKDSGIGIGDDPNDIWKKTRTACISAVFKTLQTFVSKTDEAELTKTPTEISKSYEKCLHNKHNDSLNAYKLRFRKDLTALKNFKTLFAHDLLAGKLNVQEFCDLDEKDLISRRQKEDDCKLLEEELKNKMGKQFPTNINQIKNQNVFVGEKWGISESAAKIDPEFDLE